MIFNEVDLERDGIIASSNDDDTDQITENEVTLNFLLSILAKGKDNQQQVQCELCYQRLALGESLT